MFKFHTERQARVHTVEYLKEIMLFCSNWLSIRHMKTLANSRENTGLHENVHKILPKATAEQLCPKSSSLVHLYPG